MPRHKARLERARERIAQEAARIMHEQALRDFQAAKQKACARLGFSGRAAMPRNEEIQAALDRYLRTFEGARQRDLLDALRRTAVQAMRFLAEFEPRLVGAVLDGTAGRHTPVSLHVFAEPPERVSQFLTARGIPHELSARRLVYRDGREREATVCRFVAGETAVELTVFDRLGLREAPRSPIDGRPMARAKTVEVEALLAADQSGEGGADL
ncbi:MAG: hypothetical protein KatS3mg121_1213 [Gammaproteobacteria bacterium]|nr:MAG: hypothetical protein KatS3mg121_1213 [Gammaproteobacteria bacterium]